MNAIINRQAIGNVLSEKRRAGRLPPDAAEFWLGNGAANLNAAKPKELEKLAASLGMIDPPEPCAELGEAAKFITALTGSADTRVTFQTFDDSPATRPGLARILHGTLAEQGERLREMNQRGAGVFVTINQTDLKGRKASNIIGVRALFADFDGDDAVALAEAAAFKLQPSIVVESSPGKRHMYWLLTEGAIEPYEFSSIIKPLIDATGADLNAGTIERVLRLPGFMHNKGEPLPVKLLSADGAVRYGKEAILSGFGIKSETTSSPAPKERSHDPFAAMPDRFWTIERVREVLGSLDPNMSRTQWRVVGLALKNQLGAEEAAPLFRDWSRGANRTDEKGRPTFEQFDAGWRDILNSKNTFQIGAMLALAPDGVVADIRGGDSVSAVDGAFQPLHRQMADTLSGYFSVPAVPFPMNCVNPLFRAWAEDQSKASGFDPAAYLYVLLAAFAGWVDQRSTLHVSANWKVPPFIWAGLVDGSGGGKSPVLNAALKFTETLNAKMVTTSLDLISMNEPNDRVEPYPYRQRLVRDATVEAMAELASENPEGLNCITDDISALMGKMDAYNSSAGKDRGFFLGLNDPCSFQVNRKGKPPININNLSGALIAGIQPGVFAKFIKGGASADGLFQRFTLYQMQTAGTLSLRMKTDGTLHDNVLAAFSRGFNLGIVDAHLDEQATLLAEEFANHERVTRYPGEMAKAHANKMVGYTFRIALALHMLNCATGRHEAWEDVGVDTLAAAIEIAQCLRSHAFNVYASIGDGEVNDLAQFALEEIVVHKINQFTQSELSRNNSGFAVGAGNNTNATEALNLLVERGVIRNGGTGSGRGRRAINWIVNPEVHELFAVAGVKLANARTEVHQRILSEQAARREA